MPKYTISCVVDEIDANGEIVSEDCGEDLCFELETDGKPTRVLIEHLRKLAGVSGFCT